MFIGSSVDGGSVPHLGALLKEFAQIHGPLIEAATPHFMLVKGQLPGTEVVRLRKLGIEPVSYGNDYSDLPKFLNSVSQGQKIYVRCRDVRARLHTLRIAQTPVELLLDVKTFINDVIYPGRAIRVA